MQTSRRNFLVGFAVAAAAPTLSLAGPAPTALDQVNAARMRVHLRKELELFVESVAYEPADDITRTQFVMSVTDRLNELVKLKAIHEFRIVCNDENNPPKLVNAGKWNFDVFVRHGSAEITHYYPIEAREFLLRA